MPVAMFTDDTNLASKLLRIVRSARSYAGCRRISGASAYPTITRAISPGISSSPIASAWLQTEPMVRSWRDRRGRAFVCCRGCSFVGFCGHRLTVRYTGNGGQRPICQCNWKCREGLAHAWMTVGSKSLDGAIADRVVAAVTPLTIKLALKALTKLEER